jgi:hypothetical protein
MNTFLIYIPIIITVLMVLFIFIKQYGDQFVFGEFFSISIVFIGVLSIFIFFSDSWTYKRWLNRLYFPSYSLSGELSKILLDGYWSDVEVKTILNVVVLNYKTDKNLTNKDLREYDRKLSQIGGNETLKNIKISDLVKNEKILDYLQQGIELNYIQTNKNNELTNFIITYEDIENYWKSKK